MEEGEGTQQAVTMGKSWQGLAHAVLQLASMSQLLKEGIAPKQGKLRKGCVKATINLNPGLVCLAEALR